MARYTFKFAGARPVAGADGRAVTLAVETDGAPIGVASAVYSGADYIKHGSSWSEEEFESAVAAYVADVLKAEFEQGADVADVIAVMARADAGAVAQKLRTGDACGPFADGEQVREFDT